jgi:hypothetical protein
VERKVADGVGHDAAAGDRDQGGDRGADIYPGGPTARDPDAELRSHHAQSTLEHGIGAQAEQRDVEHAREPSIGRAGVAPAGAGPAGVPAALQRATIWATICILETLDWRDAPAAPPNRACLMPATAGGPDWIEDAVHNAREELALFLRTAAGFARHPAGFARRWESGAQIALNPAAFLATAVAAVGFARLLAAAIRPARGGSTSLVVEALGAVLPFANYLLFGTLQHYTLRLFGSRRPLRDSWAMVLYAAGGPASAVTAVAMVLEAVARRMTGSGGVGSSTALMACLIAATLASFTAFLTALSLAQGGLHGPHGIRWWHILIGNLVALVVSGFAFEMIAPPGEYGLHVSWGVHRVGGTTRWTAGIGL